MSREFSHGGNLRALSEASGIPREEILDFSASINPLGPPDWFRSAVSRSLDMVESYPDPDCSSLVETISTKYGIKSEEIIIGNGSSELIFLLPQVIKKRKAIIPEPAYVDYAQACLRAGLKIESFPINEDDDFVPDLDALGKAIDSDSVVFIGQPNNPTGIMCDPARLRTLAESHRDTLFVIDEAFLGFVEGAESFAKNRPGNVVVMVSLTKLFAIPGLRLGYAAGPPGIIKKLKFIQIPWSVNSAAMAVGEAAMDDDCYIQRTIAYVATQREALARALSSIDGLKVYDGRANYLMVKCERPGMDAGKLQSELLKEGIAIRSCENFEGLNRKYFRVAVRNESENLLLVDTIRSILSKKTPAIVRSRKTPAIMLQGLSSNAGKSVLAAAMCRILFQDGYNVAPFKSQNMSLNSFVTLRGGEMGRAQVVQAQACRKDPDVKMNPILLKPNSDTGCQVITNGEPVGNMSVAEYVKYKAGAFDIAKEVYDSLASKSDCIVLEGAGSPAEINLKHHDIVNMRMAQYADAKVLLAGDIDRGGVYASFIGTYEVLEKWERKLVNGFIVNRFRGDEALLASAHEFVEKHTGKPVLGVVPFINNMGLPQEDSVEFKSGALNKDMNNKEDAVTITVVDLPHISNFTDFDPLMMEPDVSLKIARAPEDINKTDAVILPGSKNVIGDLNYLRKNGFINKLNELANQNCMIIGICGGYQMLGDKIMDPHKIESNDGTASGLGLLHITTTIEASKTLVQAEAVHEPSKLKIRGYEIHHGKTDTSRMQPAVLRNDNEVIGVQDESGNVWGTYLHGIFDDDEFRRWLIDDLRVARGLKPVSKVLAVYDVDRALDRLADVVRARLPVREIYKMMGLT